MRKLEKEELDLRLRVYGYEQEEKGYFWSNEKKAYVNKAGRTESEEEFHVEWSTRIRDIVIGIIIFVGFCWYLLSSSLS